jgi:two-component system, NtrC family, response regulator
MKPGLLIVDDDEEIRSQMKWALAEEYAVTLAEDRASALEAFQRERPAVVLLDLGLPPSPGEPTEGLATLAELRALDRMVKVVIISGQSEKSKALRAIGEGAYDFLAKPVLIEELRLILKRCFHVAQLEREYRDMQRQLTTESFEGMLGVSPQIQEVFSGIRKVAATGASVLLNGDSGTGKEMAALAVHRRSPRRDGPFVPINCGAIPEMLLESELFGHEKGAFTGAHAQRKGRIETASGGTLFLDEIGEIPLQLQVKLLRFLQEQQIERVGGRQPISIDVRVVSATNVDLKKAMAEGKFREDLYYRLAVVVLRLPPLRERREDLLMLAKAFLSRFAAQNSRKELRFSKDALMAIERHEWPGNVRELENRVKRGVIMADGNQISAADLELSSGPNTTAPRTLKEAREGLEREMVQQALRRNLGKITPAALELGISRPTFYELMDKLGIKKAED